MEGERHGRDYWQEQLSEYWDSGLTIDVGDIYWFDRIVFAFI